MSRRTVTPSWVLYLGHDLAFRYRDSLASTVSEASYAPCLVLTHGFLGGTIHEEIFTFRRLPGDNRGLEYELLVRPVIEKWGGYVRQFVSRAPGAA